MTILTIGTFGGQRPSIYDGNLPITMAQRAVNTKLYDGRLQALREPSEVATETDRIKSLYVGTGSQKECGGIRSSSNCQAIYLDNVTGCNGFDSLVVYSHQGLPHERIDLCDGNTYPLCLDGPATALAAMAGTFDPEDDRDAYVYTYTWVDRFGVETIPAPPSNMVVVPDGTSVALTGFEAAPTGAVCLRIYKTPSLFDTGARDNTRSGTNFQRIREIEVATFNGTFTDDLRMYEMDGQLLTTLEKCCAPEFDGTIQLENGQYVGWKGNSLYFSAPMEADNFPEDNRHELPDKIIACVAHFNHVFVATTGHPYRIIVQRGADQKMETDVVRFKDPYPIANRHTMVATPFGAVYASRDGLVALRVSAAPRLISKERIFPDGWPEYHPRAGAYHQGRYYGFRPGRPGWVMDLTLNEDSGLELGDLHWHTIPADFAVTTPDGRLFLVDNNVIREWEGTTNLTEYTWHSRDFQGESRSYAAMRVYAQFGPPITVKLFADFNVVLEVEVRDSKPFRLPRLPRGCRWSIQIKGSTPVQSLILGYSTQEIART